MINDLAIADDRKAAVAAEYRLMPAGKIDDAEPPHAKPKVGLDVDTFIVRPRWTSWRHWAAMCACSTGRPPLLYQPAIPHMLGTITFAPLRACTGASASSARLGPFARWG